MPKIDLNSAMKAMIIQSAAQNARGRTQAPVRPVPPIPKHSDPAGGTYISDPRRIQAALQGERFQLNPDGQIKAFHDLIAGRRRSS